MIGCRQASHRAQLQHAAVTDNERSAVIGKVVRQLAIHYNQLICISRGGSTILNHFRIPRQREGPWRFAFHNVASRTHQLVLFVDGKAHGDGSLERARQSGRNHTIKRTEILPHQPRKSHALLREVVA